ncbi:proline--tRNA ligase [Paenibacillus bovis]|uniref:Proline--tRNA ligase n=1 Tax=Paenibacillus bovis TaxID=1616788 RepID=A0A172ZHH8_9BACL|nr:proline--tRNA ligase [Paenibacillus bovis]ANF97038.1 proline--tRNA ligase [Paenibacillus bovis]
MKQSQLLAVTLRESPGDAEAASHRLLLRAGYIRQLAAGIYTYLPLGRIVLRKLEQMIREEMDRSGAQEVLLPAIQPAELWQESGRYEMYGRELIRLQDRHKRDFVLGPTHEEVITDLVRSEIGSYRQLPVILYQIQTKFRDERRPRSGLLRGREFLMKDAYSFAIDEATMQQSYKIMYDAYHHIFERCGLDFRAVEADAGSIGGQGNTHEFMVMTDAGEDTIAVCSYCGYAANLEKAESAASSFIPVSIRNEADEKVLSAEAAAFPTMMDIPATDSATGVIGITEETDSTDHVQPEKVHTPGLRTIAQLTEALSITPDRIIKTVIFLVDSQPIAVLIRGDEEINEIKVRNYLQVDELVMADADTVQRVTGAPVGFAGPYALASTELVCLADYSILALKDAIAGGNEEDYHYLHVNVQRDLVLRHIGDFRNVRAGDSCPRCQDGHIHFQRGIEVGHVFQLGDKYSAAMNATYTDSSGQDQPIQMGCYGIGVSRLVAAIVEQHHDEQGICWPASIAPYQVHLIPVSVRDEQQMSTALELYKKLTDAHCEVLLDDRNERAGVKFKDSDLIGIPIRLVIGKGAAAGEVEYVERSTGIRELLTTEQAIRCILTAAIIE